MYVTKKSHFIFCIIRVRKQILQLNTFINTALDFGTNINPSDTIIESTVNKAVTATKYTTYKSELNPRLSVHEAYTNRVYIPDCAHQAFTKVRLMSHNLKAQTDGT